ncbi:MAG: type I-C CRISPR-associated protein Cas5c [Syntrophobacter sp.]
MSEEIKLKIWGDFACFTRPEFKVDRFTYPIMTPSAARGLLESIFWKPEIRWEIREVWVLKPVREIVIVRNEISRRQNERPFFVEDAGQRQQRSSVILKDVEYLVHADIHLLKRTESPKAKYLDQFTRRVERGQFYSMPYLGLREFAAYYSFPLGGEKPVDESLTIGQMLFDIARCESSGKKKMTFIKHYEDGSRIATGYSRSLYFPARVERGVLKIPSEGYRRLYRMEGIDVL